jgi:hypothetical protein
MAAAVATHRYAPRPSRHPRLQADRVGKVCRLEGGVARADRSARQSMRAARTELVLDRMLVQIRRDEEAIELARGVAADNLAGVLADDQEVSSRSRSARPAFLDR